MATESMYPLQNSSIIPAHTEYLPPSEELAVLDQETDYIEPSTDQFIDLEEKGLESTREADTGGNEVIEQESRGWFRRNRTKLVLGVAATSVGVTLAIDPLGETTEKVIEAAPWVGSGVLASEAMFVGGAAMMLAGVGSKVGNPLTIKKRISEIASKANDSMLFKTGFWVNTVGAVGDFAVLSAGVGSTLPVHSWGVLGLTLLDLGVTVSVRKAILDGIDHNIDHEYSDQPDDNANDLAS